MGGFDLSEVGRATLRRLWWRGRFPRSFLARNDQESRAWQENFIRTFLERDIRAFGAEVPPVVLRRLWMMLAHYHGQIWNASELGADRPFPDKWPYIGGLDWFQLYLRVQAACR